MAIMPLDLTGSLTSNKITDETKTITRDTDRYFVPANGAIYDYNGSFKIYNALSGQRLQPNTQYRLLHLVDEAVKISNKNVYAIVYIVDKNVSAVRLEYQAVGGVFQNIASTINDKLSEYLLGTTGSNTIGNIVGVPVQVPPEHHLQNLGDFQGAGALVNVLENIRNSLIMGNGAAFASTYEYINYRFQQALNVIGTQFQEAALKQAILEVKTQIRDGDYIITTNSANPSTYLGYGNWVLDPNVLLYGADSPESVGNYVDVGVGTGLVAIKRYFWRRDDSAAGATYSLATSATSINEGQLATITLTTTGLATNTKIAYTITGVTENDLIGQKLNGNFIINEQGVATLPIELRQDMETEGVEIMRIALTAMPTTYVDVTVNDTSIASTYTLRFSGSANGAGDISSVNEGSKAYLAINTAGVAPGTRLYLLYNDSTVGNDDAASDTWPTFFDVATNNINIIEYNIKDDKLTEGSETLVVNVCATNSISSLVARAVLTVNDTSRSPTGSVTFSSSSTGTGELSQVNEGSTVYLFINTTNVNNGEFIDLAYAGTATSSDFSNTLPTRVTIQGNQAVVTINTLSDVKTEGDETFVVRALFNGQQLAEKTLIIKDTSVNPSYNLKFSTNSSGTDAITRVNEGQSLYLYLETTNVPDGTVLNINYSGTVNPVEDFVNYPRSLTVIGNRASAVLIIKADLSSEGEETAIVEVVSGTQSIGTAMLYINDTSASPTAAIRFSTTASGGTTITQTNEGTTVYAIVETTNVNNGTVLTVSHSGSATADDFVNQRASSVTINNNIGYVELQVKNDLLSDGLELYRLSVTMPTGEIITSTDLKIIDTSVPTVNVYFSSTAAGTGQVTSINEGQTVYLIIETNGIATGVNATLAYSGTITAADLEDTGYSQTTANIIGSRTPVLYRMSNDYRQDGDKTMTVTVTVPGITGSKQATLTVTDSSKYLRLDADGAIVVPPGKTARIVLTGGGGWANLSSTATISSASALSKLRFPDASEMSLRLGESGYAVWGYDLEHFIVDYYGQSNVTQLSSANGQPGSNKVYNIRATDTKHPNNYKVFSKTQDDGYYPVTVEDVDGICQVLTYVGRSGNDSNRFKTLNTANLSPAVWDAVEALCNPTVAPQFTFNGNTYYPGNGSGANVLCLLYQNKSDVARTIDVTLAKPSHSEMANTKIVNGAKPACFVEFFDTLAAADFGVPRPFEIMNYNNMSNSNWPQRVKPNEAYLVTMVSGGGQSYDYWMANKAAHPEREVGQTVWMTFGDSGNPDGRIIVNGGTAAKYISTGLGTQSSVNGNIVTEGTIPAYADIVGVSRGIVPYNYNPIVQSPVLSDINNATPRQRQFALMPYERYEPVNLSNLSWSQVRGYGYPGVSGGLNGAAGGIGCAATVLLHNTTAADILVGINMAGYHGAFNTVDDTNGGPGAILIQRVFLK